ncbi:MAG: hypothetical protein QM715_06335 [Nibricoccus sp.]
MYILEPALTIKPRRAVGLPVLAGEKEETLFREAKPAGTVGNFELQQAGPWRVGRIAVSIADGLEQATDRLYANLFLALEKLHLCRVWHYVPRINEPDSAGLENYRAFCHGRSLAFEKTFGAGFERRLPSASAVGTEDDELTVVFAACDTEPRHFENPEQVSAYKYPKKHGPRPPSFSRASLVPMANGSADVFISGTAAIEGHETVAPDDTAGQIERTVRNLRLISKACGLDDNLGAKRGGERHFKVYIRRANELAQIKTALEQTLLLPTDRVSYLRSDICRAELTLEIEATLMGVRTG